MYKVLIVDDEKIVRENIRSMIGLGSSQLECMCCSNALEAMEQLTDEMPDILLTDIKMPVLSGLELIKKAKQMHPNLICIILSGYAEFPLAQDAMRNGVKNYLLKPCSQKDLLDALEKCCSELDHRRTSVEQQFARRLEMINELEEKINSLRQKSGHAVSEKELEQLIGSYEDLSLLQETVFRITAQFGLSSELRASIMKLSFIEHDRAHLITYAAQILASLPNTSSNFNFVFEMKRYTEKHYANPNLTLQFLADTVICMNAKYIGKCFLRDTGQRFSEYLMSVRLENAKILLAASLETKISAIAEIIGFEDHVQYFFQVFKKYTGLTPKEYREQFGQHLTYTE